VTSSSTTHDASDLGPARTDDRSSATVGPPRDDVLVTELDGDLTVYDPRRNEVHVLNATAGDIWRLLDGSVDLDRVIEEIALAYATSAEEVRPHVVWTVARFVELDLVPSTDLC